MQSKQGNCCLPASEDGNIEHIITTTKRAIAVLQTIDLVLLVMSAILREETTGSFDASLITYLGSFLQISFESTFIDPPSFQGYIYENI
jgi:hypothetical protein